MLFACGCHAGRPQVPEGWSAIPESIDQRPAVGRHDRLQVIICYGRFFSNHSTVRLSGPGHEVLFWDPGGIYKADDPQYVRRGDLLLDRTPDLDEWWRYRSEGCREPFMKVFEWDLDPLESARLHEALHVGSRFSKDPDDFQTETSGGFCCIAVSEYLRRFAAPRIAVTSRYFWPHKLAQHLWSQAPDCVRVYEKGAPVRLYVRGKGSRRSDER